MDNNIVMMEKEKIIASDENISVTRHFDEQEFYPHKHEFIELVYIISGQMRHTVDRQEYMLSHGDMLMINYDQTHSFKPYGRAEYVNILLVPSFFESTLINSENMYEIFEISMFSEFSGRDIHKMPFVTFDGSDLLRVEEIILCMLDEFKNKKSGYKSVLSGYMRVLFSLLIRKMCECGGRDIRMRQITVELMEYIDRNLGNKITLEELAKRCFYNTSYLSRLFKKQSGITLSEYIRKKRMERAAELLRQDKTQSVHAVMEQCGYSDSKLFYAHFQECYHTTPRNFRNQR